MEPGAREEMALAVLAALYQAWDQEAGRWTCACRPGCAVCCTGRVMATTLEARALAGYLRRQGRQDLLRAASFQPVDPALRPASTFNALARLCLAQVEPPPAPEAPEDLGVCPLLEGRMCQAYPARPLACRVMASRRPCPPGGAAVQDPWWLTLGTAFFQLVEQADAGGGFGLLREVLAAVQGPAGTGLLACENLPGLPAPPEHHQRLRQALGGVFLRPVLGQPLGQRLDELRRRTPA